MRRVLQISIRMALVSMLVTGVLYPLLVWGAGAAFFHDSASGSMVERNGEIVGSRLIGQKFAGEDVFHSRPSAADYDAMASGPTNLGPTSESLMSLVRERADGVERAEGIRHGEVPVDLVTASASGLDPHITPDAAYLQVKRVAKARGLAETDVRALVSAHVEGRQLGIFGEPRVNVLELNLALDEM